MNTTHDVELPEVSDFQIARMEKNIMATIQAERTPVTKRRRWVTGLGLAAAFALGAFIAPLALGGLGAGNHVASDTAGNDAMYDMAAAAPKMYAADQAADGRQMLEYAAEESADSSAGAAVGAAARDIVKSASIELRVDAVRAAAEQIEAKVTSLGGMVQSMSVGTNQGGYPEPKPLDSSSSATDIPDTYGYLSVKVPADQLESFLKDLENYGTVTSSSVSADDQTQWGNELRAQVDSGQASLDKLNELMGQATDLSDVITLEQAIADRQAQLDWQNQSLRDLESRVAMSDVWINLTTPTEVAKPDSNGFIDGVKAGWNAFVASLYSVVVAIAFVIPWILLIGIPVWLIWWFIKRRRAGQAASADE